MTLLQCEHTVCVYVFCLILTVNGDYFPEHINCIVFAVVMDCVPHEIRTGFSYIV
jgi:hypothetical protein